MCSCDCFLALSAIVFPPFAVWVKRGICSADSLINILLCTVGFIPGLVHAWYIISKYPEPDFDYEVLPQDAEATGGGHVTYIVVQGGAHGGARHHRAHVQTAAPKIQDNMSYGTTAAAGASSNAASASAAAPAAASSSASPAAAATSSSSSAVPPAPQDNAGEGSSAAPPPSYAQAVAGDNKIQTQD